MWDEGDAFLATHLIGLYASHGRLKEAIGVLSKVSVPSAYNWATIIFAYAKHGESAEAILLYRQMRESTTVKPNDRIYVAVLKACAAAGDLSAGKEVHSHILESPGKPDIFVQTGLVDMYVKCSSLDDAWRLFGKLPQRDVVTWNAMIAGYAQQGFGQDALSLYSSMVHDGLSPDYVTYVCLLQACGIVGVGALDEGKQLHSQIEERGLQDDVVVGGSLVNMYSKCGSLVDARGVFDRLPARNVVTWNAMIAGYVQQGLGQEALSLYKCMQQEGLTPDSVTYLCLLQACASLGVGALDQGRQLHSQIQGLDKDLVFGGSLVTMYVKCGSLEKARSVFDRLPERNVVTWNAMIAGYAQQGLGEEALSLHRSMQKEGLIPDSVAFVCLLQACASVGVGALDQGKRIHTDIEERGLQDEVVVGGSLVNMYAKCGSLEYARNVFDRLPERNVVIWTAMIAGYAQQGMGHEALSLYSSMQQGGINPPDGVTYVCLLQACAIVGPGALDQGKQLQSQIEEQGLQNDVGLGGSLVSMYAKCSSLEDARSLFDRLPARNVVTWNTMITGYVQQGMGQEALSLYSSMQEEGVTAPDSVSFVCLLQACAIVGVGALDLGKQLHAQIDEHKLQEDLVVVGSLISMYAKCGSLEDACSVFDRLQTGNVLTWECLLQTYVCLLQACASVGVDALDHGKQFHAQIEERGLHNDVVVGGTLVNMYAKCGSLEDARTVFDKLPDKSVVTWNGMLAGYTHQGMGQEAISLFAAMQQEGITPPDAVTFVCLLQACAIVAALPLGRLLHAQIDERGMQADVIVGAALVNMYAKSGSMLEAQQVFDSLPERTIETWGALAGGYSRQGDSKVVFDLLGKMRLQGIQPDGITLLSVLTVCSHVGLVDKGREYFEAMRTDYGISPTVEHYTCMMDLLGRAGHLDEALQMAKTMPFPPNGTVWRTLLGACQKWNNVHIGQQAFDGAVSVDGKDASSYVLMSNLYASAQMWDKANEMQSRRKKLGAWKKQGQSWWTDMHGVVHTFVAGSTKNPESENITSVQGWNR